MFCVAETRQNVNDSVGMNSLRGTDVRASRSEPRSRLGSGDCLSEWPMMPLGFGGQSELPGARCRFRGTFTTVMFPRVTSWGSPWVLVGAEFLLVGRPSLPEGSTCAAITTTRAGDRLEVRAGFRLLHVAFGETRVLVARSL